jgi:tetratricopeptide (TPR) repeat protein
MEAVWMLAKDRNCRVLTAVAGLLLACGTAPVSLHGQSAPEVEPKVDLSLLKFQKLDGPSNLSVLETMLPELIRAGLLGERWLVVKIAPDSGAGGSQPASKAENAASTGARDLSLTGSFVEVDGKVRVDVDIKDNAGGRVVFSDFVLFAPENVMPVMDEFSKRIARALRPAERTSTVGGRPVQLTVGPFDPEKSSSKYGFYRSVLESVLGRELSDLKLPNITVKFATKPQIGGDPALLVSGRYTVTHSETQVHAILTDTNGLNLKFELAAGGDATLLPAKMLARRIAEIVRARLTDKGAWRQLPLPLSGATTEQYQAAGDSFRALKQYDTAIFMYRLAAQGNPVSVGPDLRLADLYTVLKDTDAATAEYQSIAGRNEKSDAAQLAQGMIAYLANQPDDAIKTLSKVLASTSLSTNLRWRIFKALGDAYLIKGDRKEAISQYQQAQALNAKLPDLYIAIARAYAADRKTDDALKQLKVGTEQLPDSADISAELASLEVVRAADLFQSQNFKECLDAAADAIGRKPSDPKVLSRAYAYSGAVRGLRLAKSDMPDGIEDLKSAIAADPEDEYPYRLLGLVQQRMGNYPEAIVSLNKSLSIQPTYFGYSALSDLYSAVHDYGRAAETLQRGIALSPSNAVDGNIDLALIFSRSGDYPRALDFANKAAALDPRNERVYRILGSIHENLGAYEDALGDYEKANGIGPTKYAYYGMASIYQKLSRLELAEQAARQALAKDAQFGEAAGLLAQIQFERGNYAEAVKTAESAIAMQFDQSTAILALLRAYHAEGKDSIGIERVRGYLDAHPDSGNLPSALAAFYHSYLFDYPAAYEMDRKAYDLDRDSLELAANLAEASLTAGHFAEASELANKVLSADTGPSVKLSSRLVLIGSLICQERQANAVSEVGQLLRDYRATNFNWDKTWTYPGLKHYVSTNQGIAAAEKELLLALVRILELPKAEGDLQEAEFEKTLLPAIYERLRAEPAGGLPR